MSTNKTKTLGLSQWEKTDPVRMEDFNADNALVDAAVSELRDADEALSASLASLAGSAVHIASGTFRGNGASSRSLEFGFLPKLLILAYPPGAGSSTWGLAIRGCYTFAGGVGVGNMSVSWGADSVTWSAPERDIALCNDANATMAYFALG